MLSIFESLITKEVTFSGIPLVGKKLNEFLSILLDDDPEKAFVQNCNISPREVHSIAQILAQNHSLQELDLSNNPLDDVSCKILAVVFAKHPALRKINLTNCKIGNVGARILLDAFSTKASLVGKTVILDKNPITAPVTDMITNRVKIQPPPFMFSIKDLVLPASVVVDWKEKVVQGRGVEVILEALENNALRQLRLRACTIGANDVIKIFDAIALNTSLRDLDLSGIILGPPVLDAFVKMLKVNQTMQNIFLNNCGLTNANGPVLLAALAENSSVKTMYLEGNARDVIENITQYLKSRMAEEKKDDTQEAGAAVKEKEVEKEVVSWQVPFFVSGYFAGDAVPPPAAAAAAPVADADKGPAQGRR